MSRWAVALACLVGCGDGYAAHVFRDSELLATFDVELADTAAARAQGLRGAPPLQPHQGLVLIFPRALDDVCLDNRDVRFAIDAVIAGDDGLVHAVATLEPNDPQPRCHDRVRWILEVAAGAAAAIRPGDTLRIER